MWTLSVMSIGPTAIRMSVLIILFPKKCIDVYRSEKIGNLE